MPDPNPSPPAHADIQAMSFEDALAELETIVRRIEQGQARLDDSIAAYERGVALRRHCEAKLKDAEAKIETIAVAADGSVTLKPLDA